MKKIILPNAIFDVCSIGLMIFCFLDLSNSNVCDMSIYFSGSFTFSNLIISWSDNNCGVHDWEKLKVSNNRLKLLLVMCLKSYFK